MPPGPASFSQDLVPCIPLGDICPVLNFFSQVLDFEGWGQGGSRGTSPQGITVSRGHRAPVVAGPVPQPRLLRDGSLVAQRRCRPTALRHTAAGCHPSAPSWVTGPPHGHGAGVPTPHSSGMFLSAVTFTLLHVTFRSVPLPRCVCHVCVSWGGGAGRGLVRHTPRPGVQLGLETHSLEESTVARVGHRSRPLPSCCRRWYVSQRSRLKTLERLKILM